MSAEPKLPNCTIEASIPFSVTSEKFEVFPNGKSIVIEFKDAIIHKADEKHVIKTFSDATLIDEISRRYDIDLIINKIKE